MNTNQQYHDGPTYNDTLARVAATYCTEHAALPGVPCHRFDDRYADNVATGYCATRIAAAVATTEAAHADAVHAERERSRARNKAA